MSPNGRKRPRISKIKLFTLAKITGVASPSTDTLLVMSAMTKRELADARLEGLSVLHIWEVATA